MRKVSSVRSPFAKKLLRLADHYEPWRIWSDFITMFAIAISNQVDSEESEQWESREEMYQKISGRYTAEEMTAFADLTAGRRHCSCSESGSGFSGRRLYGTWPE